MSATESPGGPQTTPPTPVLHSARLTLRPFAASDGPRVAALCNDFDVAKMLSVVPHPYSAADAEFFLTRVVPGITGCCFAIEEAVSGQLVGCVSIDGVGVASRQSHPDEGGEGEQEKEEERAAGPSAHGDEAPGGVAEGERGAAPPRDVQGHAATESSDTIGSAAGAPSVANGSDRGTEEQAPSQADAAAGGGTGRGFEIGGGDDGGDDDHSRRIQQDPRTGVIGYWLGRGAWGRGLATEAAAVAVDHAFGALGCAAVAGSFFAENPGSAKVLRKLGFRGYGAADTRMRCVARGGALLRARHMLLRREWWAAPPGPRAGGAAMGGGVQYGAAGAADSVPAAEEEPPQSMGTRK